MYSRRLQYVLSMPIEPREQIMYNQINTNETYSIEASSFSKKFHSLSYCLLLMFVPKGGRQMVKSRRHIVGCSSCRKRFATSSGK